MKFAIILVLWSSFSICGIVPVIKIIDDVSTHGLSYLTIRHILICLIFFPVLSILFFLILLTFISNYLDNHPNNFIKKIKSSTKYKKINDILNKKIFK